jgi:hypothetical protein
MGWTAGFYARQGEDFFLLHRVHTGCGAHLAPTQWAPGTLSSRVKRPGREASTGLKNDGATYLHPHTSSWRSA